MNPMLNTGLALVAIVILATALSATKDGARLVQAGIVIAIIVVILKNSDAVQTAAGNLTRLVSSAPKQSTGSGGN